MPSTSRTRAIRANARHHRFQILKHLYGEQGGGHERRRAKKNPATFDEALLWFIQTRFRQVACDLDRQRGYVLGPGSPTRTQNSVTIIAAKNTCIALRKRLVNKASCAPLESA